MRVAIVGSRNFDDKKVIFTEIANVLDGLKLDIVHSRVTVISGGARGVDTVAKEFAEAFKLDFICFEPYFVVDKSAEYSPRHFFVRNTQIVANADILIAIAFGESKGTRHSYSCAKTKGIPCFLLEVTEDDDDSEEKEKREEQCESDSGCVNDETNKSVAGEGTEGVEEES